MIEQPSSSAVREWIEHDPDPVTAAELQACSDDELAERFARPLTFGTAGLRGPMRGGPSGMNLAVVMRTSWAVAQVLKERGLGGSRRRRRRRRQARLGAVRARSRRSPCRRRVSGDADVRRGPYAGDRVRCSASRRAARAFRSPRRTIRRPTTDTRCTSTAALQIVPPTDREIETLIGKAPHADEIPRAAVETSGVDLIQRYVESRGACPAHRTDRCGWPSAPCTASAVSTHSMHSSGRGCPTYRWSRVSSRPTRTSPPFRSPTRRSRAPPTNC